MGECGWSRSRQVAFCEKDEEIRWNLEESGEFLWVVYSHTVSSIATKAPSCLFYFTESLRFPDQSAGTLSLWFAEYSVTCICGPSLGLWPATGLDSRTQEPNQDVVCEEDSFLRSALHVGQFQQHTPCVVYGSSSARLLEISLAIAGDVYN